MQGIYSEIWSSLPQSAKAQFESVAISMSLRRGDVVYREGDTPKGVYWIQRGLVGLVLLGQGSGKEHLVRFFKDGQFFGHRSVFAEETHHATATALEPTVLRMIPSATLFRTFDEHPELYRIVLQVLARELRRSEVQRVIVLENQVLARTAQALIYLKDLHPHHKWTRQEIANFCASTVSTVIKSLAELEDRGLVRQEKRDIHILDREGLIALQNSEP